MKPTRIFTKNQMIHFNNISYSSFAIVDNENETFYFCLNNNQIVILIHKENQFIEEKILQLNFENVHLPTHEEIRILNQAQKNLAGIMYTPLWCSNHQMICHAQIDDIHQSEQLLILTIELNTKGYFEIIAVQNLLII